MRRFLRYVDLVMVAICGALVVAVPRILNPHPLPPGTAPMIGFVFLMGGVMLGLEYWRDRRAHPKLTALFLGAATYPALVVAGLAP